MPVLPGWIAAVLAAFAPLFSRRVWAHTQLLVAGALLSPGKRTVTSALRVMGLSGERHFQNYHRVLARARWSSLQASRILLGLLVAMFAPSGPLVFGLDDTVERRRGAKIKAKGIYRDPVRSSKSHFVKTSGLRWLCLMLLVPIPWASRVWALPVLTALAPSERYNQEHSQRHKKLTDWARLMLSAVRRWLPDRQIIVVADSAYSVIEWLWALRQFRRPVTVITRLRLDAALFTPAPARQPGQRGRNRVIGSRLPSLASLLKAPNLVWKRVSVANWYGQGEREVEVASSTAVWYHGGKPPVPIRWVLVRDPQRKFETQALLSTDPDLEPKQILEWFVQRWCLEVTFEEARAHLGVETQRQWSDSAIARTTPALFGLFSLVTLLAHQRWDEGRPEVRQAAWYEKARPTFVDALAMVRGALWRQVSSRLWAAQSDSEQIPKLVLERLMDAVCYAA